MLTVASTITYTSGVHQQKEHECMGKVFNTISESTILASQFMKQKHMHDV